MSPALYNEVEPYAAAWLRNLIARGHIAPGTVDDRSIRELEPADVAGPGQRHFFAGVGAWSYALRLAGWPDDVAVWTGSCPCQPFSAAGRRGGFDDERHLWPTWFGLIRECSPAVVFGEQVASRDGLDWLDLVLSDLESAGYTVAAVDLPAAGVGAPHIRQRLFFVALAGVQPWRLHLPQRAARREDAQAQWCGEVGFTMAERRGAGRFSGSHGRAALKPVGYGHDCWSDCDWIFCSDGKYRPVEPGTFPLAHRAPARVGRLRAYGNAIVPQAARVFVQAVMAELGEPV